MYTHQFPYDEDEVFSLLGLIVLKEKINLDYIYIEVYLPRTVLVLAPRRTVYKNSSLLSLADTFSIRPSRRCLYYTSIRRKRYNN